MNVFLFACFSKQLALYASMGLCFLVISRHNLVKGTGLAKCHFQNVYNLAFADYSSHVLGDKDMQASNFLCIFWFELENLNCQEMGNNIICRKIITVKV